ncbi:MAG: FecR domain-containing protein [Caldilineales bacterium]
MASKNPTGLAWIILLTSFAVFCALLVSLPLAVRWYVLHSQVTQVGVVRVTSGTVLLAPSSDSDPIALIDMRSIEPGTVIKTDQRSQAALVFQAVGKKSQPGPEISTVQIYPAAEVVLTRASRPRFALSTDPVQFSLEVRSGRVRVYVAGTEPEGQRFTLTTPHAEIELAPGSYSVETNVTQTQLTVRFGEATLRAQGQQVVVASGTNSTVLAGQPPTAAASGDEELIVNGDFQTALGPPNWLITIYPADDATAGSAEVTDVDGRMVTRLRRINQPPTHSEVGITQVLEKDVRDFDYLNLQMDVLLRWQSLPGAGEQSSEFPLMLRLDYEDVYGNHQFWTHGFYYQEKPPQWVVTGGEKIPQNTWYPFESGNLLERLKTEGLPPMATLNYLKLYASGHNYESLVAEISLVAR